LHAVAHASRKLLVMLASWPVCRYKMGLPEDLVVLMTELNSPRGFCARATG
jgi:hypothetical protein